eukprot:CAMPEP_0117588838 /NCGR_PEP_ID=MMETSP0784-20121206/70073_1 /TAXON_ID=39447 /ORGANISM="" /LENGTH=289 /DNA_ID=CAMNT_0005390241 /DNA_START=9 /DNA_END=875 /DNA_ORIENTATION=-
MASLVNSMCSIPRRMVARRAFATPRMLMGSATMAGAGMYVGGIWSEWTALHAPEELASEAGLPDPEEASQFSAVHLPSLLTDREINEILRLGEEIRSTGAATVYRTGESALASAHSRDIPRSKPLASQWCTTYMHFAHTFQSELPLIYKKIVQAALQTDAEHWGIWAVTAKGRADRGREENGIHARTIELHEVTPGGALPQQDHHDAGSCVTVDIMLGKPGEDFTGGAVQFPAPSMADQEAAPDRLSHSARFEKGDALIFPSHKFHCVRPVESGLRRVCVLELWCGAER